MDNSRDAGHVPVGAVDFGDFPAAHTDQRGVGV